MKRMFKKIFSILTVMLLVCALSMTLISCNKGESKKEEPTVQEVFDGLSMSDKTFEYDGNPHSILLEGDLPEGASVEYKNNAQINPGKYNVKAKVTYKDRSITKSAFMTITYKTSTLTVEDNQVGYVNTDKAVFPSYTLNNTEQEVVCIVKRDGAFVDNISINRAGTYELELYAPQSTVYAESNHVKVKFTVKESQFGVAFNSETKVIDGSVKTLELTGTLPAGYTVEYSNNSGSEAGKYFAVATIKDSAGTTVEVHRAVLTLDNPNDTAFEAYLDAFFVEYLEGDQLSVNIFCENPSDFGLERYEAKWYTYSGSGSSDDNSEAVEMFKEMLTELHAYNKSSLSDRQQIAYEQIEKFLTYQRDFYSIQDVEFMNNYYVDQFGGYVADFGTYMEAYSLRGKEEVQDVIDFINSTKTAFPSYLKYLDDKVKAGYPLSDYTLTEMSKYLGEVLSSMEKDGNYYLEDVLSAKIAALDFLNDAEKTSYTQALADAFDNSFKVGVQELKDGLLNYVGKLAKDKEGYYAAYGEAGKQLYLLELNDLLGLNNFNIDSYIAELEDAYADAQKKSAAAQDYLFSNYPVNSYLDLERLTQKTEIFAGTPEEKLEFLKEFARSVVPTLEHTPEITIKEMDKASAKVSNAVAYYMKSALDNDKAEFITLNPLKVGSGNDVIGTLSHEGYPGHLYAYIFTKQLDLHNITRIMTSTAHGEGWATYVELKLYEYIMDTSKDETLVDVCNYLYYDHLSSFLLETLLDVYIHYSGYSVKDVADFLDDNGLNGGAAQSIYNLLIETPASYPAYGYGKLFFYNLHQEAKKKLGRYYDEVELNTILLSKGWTSLGKLRQTFDIYIRDVAH
ncbi:MAG: DUF885 domain-containing protein, partial [Anaeroplasmataceae bacterium]|nr:DUF885 domain-containing protein [Anaeroplasmataceae bacterium]